jgi:uncharacterized protein YbbC (DUF1343 family)
MRTAMILNRLFLMLPFLLAHHAHPGGTPAVKCGADVLVEERLDLVRGKRVGLITNQTGKLISGEFLVDALRSKGITVTALFAPEHGIRGNAAAGESYGDTVDLQTGIPVYSLYGRVRKPTAAMLHNVDVLVYDIQDVGVRCYTYISTMASCMESSAEAGIPFILLDRPDPLGGLEVDGPVLPDSLKSFVGFFPIPMVYGLTAGELAKMAEGEGWLEGKVHPSLTVVPMHGWKRNMTWKETGLSWTPPSPNIPTFESALMYPMTVYLEATNMSEGRGTSAPFRIIGAPFLGAHSLSASLSFLTHCGMTVEDTSFIPQTSKHEGVRCEGVFLSVIGTPTCSPVASGVRILLQLRSLARGEMQLNRRSLGRLLGDTEALDLLARGETVESLTSRWEAGLSIFHSKSAQYYLYPKQ